MRTLRAAPSPRALTLRRSVVIAALTCVATVAALAAPAPAAVAAAGSGAGSATSQLDDGDAVVDGTRTPPVRSRGGTHTPPSTSASTSTSTRPTFHEEWVLACAGNGPGGGADVLCGSALTSCPPGQTQRWLVHTPLGPDGQPSGSPEHVETKCMPDTETEPPGDPAAAFPGFTVTDLRRLPLPPGTAHVEPGTGYVMINVPTNVFAEARQAVLSTTVVGLGVQVRVTPVSYTWSFGDGGTLGPTGEPGAPYPALTLTHTYTQPQAARITLTTTYRGEYSVEGGPWTPIDGTADVTSAPVAVTALAGHPALVADALTPAG